MVESSLVHHEHYRHYQDDRDRQHHQAIALEPRLRVRVERHPAGARSSGLSGRRIQPGYQAGKTGKSRTPPPVAWPLWGFRVSISGLWAARRAGIAPGVATQRQIRPHRLAA